MITNNNITARTKHLECEFGATYKCKRDYSQLLFIFHFVLQAIVRFSFCFTSYRSFFILFHKISFVFSQALGSFLDGNHGMFSIRFVYIQHIVEGMTFSLPHIFPNHSIVLICVFNKEKH